MKKKILIGSIIAVVIILLSSFSSVVGKVSSDDELVEFDVEFCGLGKKHTVQLTQQEADEVELLFDDIEQRLSKVETREETEEIFKEAVVELDRYGFHGNIGMEDTQSWVTDEFHKPFLTNIFERNKITPFNSSINLLCFVATQVKDSADVGIPFIIGFTLGSIAWILCLLTGNYNDYTISLDLHKPANIK